jgi:hypothetical protein
MDRITLRQRDAVEIVEHAEFNGKRLKTPE